MNLLQPVLLLVVMLATGCASQRTNLIARTGGPVLPAQIRNVSLMPRASLSPAERVLETQLAAELQRRGIPVVPQHESDFTVAAVIEENWDIHDIGPSVVYQTRPPVSAIYSAGAPAVVIMEPAYHPAPESGETHIRTEGIRLRLYRTADLKQGRFQTAWEGYIEAGLALRPERQPVLLEILCGYLGRDFIGHVKTGK